MHKHLESPGRQAGFSLVETLIAIVVAGLLLSIAIPRVRQILVLAEIKSARAAVVNTYSRARIYALQSRTPASVHFNGSRTWVTYPDGASIDTVGAVVDLAMLHGVTVAASQPRIDFLPTGLAASGSAVKVVVARGGYRDSVIISGYGRLQ